MKTLLKSTGIALTLLALVACKETKENATTTSETAKTTATATQEFTDAMVKDVWINYVALKTAFVQSDAATAQTAAQTMAQGINDTQADLKSLAQEIAATTDLEKQRVLFSTFTDSAGPLFKEALSSGTIYKQFCPMAFNNTGAFWYSDAAQIRNPYYGDMMLTCGAVKETIKR